MLKNDTDAVRGFGCKVTAIIVACTVLTQNDESGTGLQNEVLAHDRALQASV